MHLPKYIAKATVIALTLIMASIAVVVPIQSVEAQTVQSNGSVPLPVGVTPDATVKTTAQLSFRPNPVGLGQTIIVNMWVSPALHVSRYLSNFKVAISKPDGSTDEKALDSYEADATAWFEYTVDQIGTWKLKFDFPGGYFPAGIYITPSSGARTTFNGSCYYQPSSTNWQELTVQQEPILSWPPSALPTDYWTRPVAFELREWSSILGNFPWQGIGGGPNWPANTNKYWDTRLNFIPYVQAPNSAHIVWKRQIALSGLVGAGQGYDALTTGSGGPSIIYQGKCYQVLTAAGGKSDLQCYDLRTGEIFWEIPSPLPSGGSLAGIEYTGLTTPAVPGAVFQAAAGASLIAMNTGSGDRLLKLNPATGAASLNISIQAGRHVYHRNGYVLTCQDLGAAAGANRYRLINWTTLGSSTNFTARIQSNITWPFSRGPAPGVGCDFEVGLADGTSGVSLPQVQAMTALNVVGASLTTGQVLWNITYDVPPFDPMQAYCADHGKIAVVTMDGRFTAWDLATGKLAWQSEQMDYPWDSTGFGTYGTASAYGLLWRFAYSGIYAFDWTNGKIVWKYEAPTYAGYETPYVGENNTNVYPFDAGGYVTDGKVYSVNAEHTPTAPITRGWGIHCLNATTGDLVWKVIIPCSGVGGGTSGSPGGIAAIADGYMVVSGMDGIMYTFGKGKSATTVTAPDVVVAKGSGVVIKGTVLDMSPAQLGTPCVSKDSMSTQMEYIHKQLPIDGLWHNETITGVPVKLTALASDGSFTDIGTVTTDGYYGTFSKTWTPPNEGDYQIIASFAGDDSYGSSAASTSISVGPAPASPETGQQQQITVPDYTMTIIGAAIAVIIAVAIVGVLIVRKK